MSWVKVTLTENSLRMAKATWVRDRESKPCSMNVEEVLICERSSPHTGTSRSRRREARRSLREESGIAEPTLTVGPMGFDDSVAGKAAPRETTDCTGRATGETSA